MIFHFSNKKTFKDFLKMQNSQVRTVLVTGSNKGIGYGIVESLLAGSTPYNVILTSRSVELGEKAAEALRNKYSQISNNLVYHQLDINDDQSVSDIASWLRKTFGKLDVLVNNAGILHYMSNDEQKTQTLQTNFFNTVKFTEKLLPLLSEDGKIVMISSDCGQITWQGKTLQRVLENPQLTEEELYEAGKNIIELTKDFGGHPVLIEPSYPASKALLNKYVREFLLGKLQVNQQVYAVHPGWVKTDLGGPDALLSLEEGADTAVYLVNLPFVRNEELNAKFIGSRKVMSY